MIEQSQVMEKLLELLRRWGWEAGAAKLRAELGVDPSSAGTDVEGFFQSWLAAERGEYETAESHGQSMTQSPVLAGWAQFVRAFVAMRRKQHGTALRLLDEAAERGPADLMRSLAVLHIRATVLFHQGQGRAALDLLKQVKQQLPESHFAFGRVLDTMGMVYGSLGNFDAARAFFREALKCKEPNGDTAGLALSHGQLGRLHLEWGLLDAAEEHFKQDRSLCNQTDDQRGHAQMSNALGQVALARGDWTIAAQWLDSALRECRGRSDWEVIEGYAHKDRALAYLAGAAAVGQEDGAPATNADLEKAEAHLQAAEKLFGGLREPFAEGLAHVNRAWGALLRLRGQWDDSRQRLRDAVGYFQRNRELVELTAAQLQLARTDRAMGETGAPAVEAVRAALYTAEESRRPEAVRRAELELRQVSLADYYARLHERARGRGADADPTSLITGVRVSGTILFLDLKNSSLFGRDHDPATVMLTINQMMAHISHALRRHEGRINQFLGDGFLARFLGDDHARQAVEAGLEMNEAMKEFNEPRDLLRLPPFEVRIGINTGELCLGNVGTYEKMEFASLGSTTNFAARLQSLAEPGRPCIGRSTRDAVGDRYAYAKPEGKDEEAKGFGVVRFWEVTGRKG